VVERMNDDDDKKKKKKTFPDDFPDDFSAPFDFFSSWEDFNMEEIMERIIPYFKGSSFGKMIDEMMKNLMKNLENVDSSEFEDLFKNPFVYGFKIGVGPDGKPNFGQFGNLKPKEYGDIETSDVREPLIDVFKEDKCVRIIAEVPGVNKGDIHLTGSKRTLTIKAHSKSRKYEKSVSLPVPVNIKSAKAKYKNGVLEVVIDRKDSKKEEDHEIDVN
jgi:HSP20 family protein